MSEKIERTPHRPSWVYFVHAPTAGLIKIGVATNLDSRLRNLAHGSPVPLRVLGVKRHEEAASLEAALHEEFAVHRRHGEWFAADKLILDYIVTRALPGEKALARLNRVLSYPTMSRGRPSKEQMEERALAGLGNWR